MPRFSILTPYYNHSQDRIDQLERCIGSVANQTFKDFEMILIDDGSRMDWKPPEYPWLKVFHQEHLERLYALNAAFKVATGEIICLLDSDDQYMSFYLECVDDMYKKFPDFKIFNFGSIHCHPNYEVRLRGAFKPAVKEVGHEFFGGGNIVKGTFVFKKECITPENGFVDGRLYPERTNPWDFSADAQKEFPELVAMYTITNDVGNRVVREIGNPMGDDFFLYYKLTRKLHSKPLDLYLYIANHKGQRGLRV